MLNIKKATKAESKLRLAMIGASGSGKTYSALSVGSNLGKNDTPARMLVVDTEHGSASKYADIFEFDVVELTEFSPDKFIEVIELVNKMPEADRYDVLILDSLSHAWMGKGGILEQHGNAEARTKNSFTAWKDVTPKHTALIEAIVQSRVHLIATMRAKTDYAMKQEGGRTKVETVGLAPVQRDGMEYEFDVVAHLDEENNFIVKKTRCPTLSGKVFNQAGIKVAEILKVWLKGEKNPPTTVILPAAMQQTPLTQPTTTPEAPQTRTAELQQQREESAVSPETTGRLLAEAGSVSQNAAGYVVTETVFGEKVDFQIVKRNNIVQCSCEDYKQNATGEPAYNCAHKWAVKLSLIAKQTAQQKAA